MTDYLGFVAAGFALASAGATSMRALRLASLLSNLCFIGYGLWADLLPVLMLHFVLAPANAFQLWRLARDHPAGKRRSTSSAHHEQPAGMASSLKS